MNILKIDQIITTDQESYEELKNALHEEIKKYEIEVTDTNLKDAKSLATTLNKLDKEVKEVFKNHLKPFEEEIKSVKAKQKELSDIIQGGRRQITEQINKFSEMKLNRAVEALNKLKNESIATIKNRDNIDVGEIDITDLYKITSCNFKGYEVSSIKKDVQDIIINRVVDKARELKQAKELEEAQRAKEEAERKAREERIRAEEKLKAEREKQEALKRQEEQIRRQEAERVRQEALKAQTPQQTKTEVPEQVPNQQKTGRKSTCFKLCLTFKTSKPTEIEKVEAYFKKQEADFREKLKGTIFEKADLVIEMGDCKL